MAPAQAGDDEIHRAQEIVVEDQAESAAIETFGDRPVETEVIDRKEIERRPGNNAADIVGNLPGIRTQQRVQGEEAAVSVEGLPAEFSRVLVDGRRYSGEIGAVDDLSDVSVVGIERLEVIRGAQGLRYGTEAAGAVIRAVTMDPPRDGRRIDAQVGAGNEGKFLGATSVGYGNENYGASLRFIQDQIDGYDPPGNTRGSVFIPSSSDSRGVARDAYAIGRLEPGNGVTLHSRLGFRREDENLVGIGGTDVNGKDEESRWIGAQEGEWEFGPASKLSGALSYYRIDQNSSVGREFTILEDEPELEMSVEHLLDTGPVSHALTFGSEFQRPALALQEGALPANLQEVLTPSESVDESFFTSGIFAIAESQFAEWLALETGVRAQFHSDFSPKVVPQIALVATPWQRDDGRVLRFRISYGQSYRTPSLRDLFQPPAPQLGGAYFLAGNPDLIPESLVSYRAGFEAVPLPWMSLSMIGFYHDIDDHIRSSFVGSLPIGTETIDAPPGTNSRPGLGLICSATNNFFPECNGGSITVPVNAPLFRKNNLDRVRTSGIESRVHIRPHPLCELDIGYTLQNSEVRDSNVDIDELPNEPHHVVDLRLELEAPRFGTLLTTQARFRSAALTETSGTGGLGFGSPEKSQPSWTVDLRLEQPIGANAAVYADVFNISDQRFVDSYIVRGRTFFLGVRATFQ